MTTIAISERVQAILKALKTHPRQSYSEVIEQVLANYMQKSDSEPENTQSDSEGEEKKGSEIYKDFGEAAELWTKKD